MWYSGRTARHFWIQGRNRQRGPAHIGDTGRVGTSDEPRQRRHGSTGDTRVEAIATIFPPGRAARLGAGLWATAGATGLVAAVLPHGPGVQIAGWVGLGLAALAVAGIVLRHGERITRAVQFAMSLAGVAAVGGAVALAHGAATADAATLVYVTLTVYAASFYPDRALVAYLAFLDVSAGAALVATGVPGAPAAWAAVTLTTGAVAGAIRALEHALGRAANTDPLTGLMNRRALEPLLDRELARCARLGHPLCVAVIDLDGFKHVNDTLGHHAGDRLLVEVTRSWRSALRTFDVLARSGGDEFLLVLPSTSSNEAATVLQRLRRVHDQHFSAGIAQAAPGNAPSALLRRADAACYEAKKGGRRRTEIASDEAEPTPTMAGGRPVLTVMRRSG